MFLLDLHLVPCCLVLVPLLVILVFVLPHISTVFFLLRSPEVNSLKPGEPVKISSEFPCIHDDKGEAKVMCSNSSLRYSLINKLLLLVVV